MKAMSSCENPLFKKKSQLTSEGKDGLEMRMKLMQTTDPGVFSSDAR
jgi:hypothetical protein